MARQSSKYRPRIPLDQSQLRAMALAYVGRYATTSAKLSRYLARKIAERGWQDATEPDVEKVAAKMAEAGFINDEEFARNRASVLQKRGFGAARVRLALRGAGIERSLGEQASNQTPEEALEAALQFARHRRLGRFGQDSGDPKIRRRQLASMIRAGHTFEVSRIVLDCDDDG